MSELQPNPSGVEAPQAPSTRLIPTTLQSNPSGIEARSTTACPTPAYWFQMNKRVAEAMDGIAACKSPHTNPTSCIRKLLQSNLEGVEVAITSPRTITTAEFQTNPCGVEAPPATTNTSASSSSRRTLVGSKRLPEVEGEEQVVVPDEPSWGRSSAGFSTWYSWTWVSDEPSWGRSYSHREAQAIAVRFQTNPRGVEAPHWR